jgi:hypothetical protein
MAPGSVDSAAAVVMPVIGVNEPGTAIPSTPFCTCTCTTLPSARAAKNTARPVPSGDLVARAVATAGALRPWVEAALRFVTSSAKTPPATGSGAPLSGAPPGSMTVMVPWPASPSSRPAWKVRAQQVVVGAPLPPYRVRDRQRLCAKSARRRTGCRATYRDVPNLARLRGDPAFKAFLSRLPTQWEGYRRDLLPPPACSAPWLDPSRPFAVP